MHQHTVSAIHNLAFIGQSGAGKTSLIKQLISLTNTKASILTDTIQETLDATPWYAEHKGTHINLLDSPGYPELSGRAMEVLTACDAAILVLNASRGVEFFSQQIMAAAKERHLCRMIVVNHIDGDRQDIRLSWRPFKRCLEMSVCHSTCHFPAGMVLQTASLPQSHRTRCWVMLPMHMTLWLTKSLRLMRS